MSSLGCAPSRRPGVAAVWHSVGVPDPISRRTLLAGSLAAVAAVAAGCSRGGNVSVPTASSARPSVVRPRPSTPVRSSAAPVAVKHDPASVARRATVPVLCWHQLRDWTAGDSAYDRQLLICPPAAFRAQLDALAAGGYTTITTDQYFDHLTVGAPLPPRPVMLTFDDSQGSQISAGLPELMKRRMTGTFFVMTVVLDKPRWLSRADVRRLAHSGMTVAAHTWDHQRADRYAGRDWQVELVQPRAELERITGKPVRDFAYPYGIWDPADFPHLAAAGYRTAYQLGGEPLDRMHPLFSLRRILVDSGWTGPELLRKISGSSTN
jgi:peptidoglycan/xylan/chitin deacetylase (PgdA/CDA1 family)